MEVFFCRLEVSNEMPNEMLRLLDGMDSGRRNRGDRREGPEESDGGDEKGGERERSLKKRFVPVCFPSALLCCGKGTGRRMVVAMEAKDEHSQGDEDPLGRKKKNNPSQKRHTPRMV